MPDGESDPRGDQTAMAIAAGGVICPVPFLMSGAAMRIASHRSTRLARIAYWLGAATIVAQAAGLVAIAIIIAR
jgi:hypothetical protein